MWLRSQPCPLPNHSAPSPYSSSLPGGLTSHVTSRDGEVSKTKTRRVLVKSSLRLEFLTHKFWSFWTFAFVDEKGNEIRNSVTSEMGPFDLACGGGRNRMNQRVRRWHKCCPNKCGWIEINALWIYSDMTG